MRLPIFSVNYKHKSYLVLLGAFIINLSLGNYYSSGSIQNQIVTYMQNNSKAGSSVNSNNIIIIFGLMIFGMGSAVCAGGFMAKKIGAALTILIGGFIMNFNVILTYYTIKSYLPIIALNYGFIAGIGNGLAYGVAMGVPIKYFPNHKGLAMGITISGFGLSPIVFSIIQSFIVNGHENLEYLPLSFVILGVSFIILQIIGAILVREEKNINCSENSSLDRESCQGSYAFLFHQKTRSLYSEADIKPHNVIMEYDFWILWLTMLFMYGTNIIVTSIHTKLQVLMKMDTVPVIGSLTEISLISGLANVTGRIVGGYLTTRFRYKVLMLSSTITIAILCVTIFFLKFIPSPAIGFSLYTIWITIMYFCFGGNLAVFPWMCERLFGMKNFVCNYGLLTTAVSISTIIVTSVTPTMEYEPDHSKLCLILFSVGCLASLLAAGLTLLFRGKSLMMFYS